jgi:hypothetical protein
MEIGPVGLRQCNVTEATHGFGWFANQIHEGLAEIIKEQPDFLPGRGGVAIDVIKAPRLGTIPNKPQSPRGFFCTVACP